MLDLDRIRAAARRLDGVAHKTPVVTSRTLEARTGATVFLKAENLQRGGAFKFRGAYNAISCLSPAERARGVCAWSSGNHAQAVALAAKMHDTKATILMPLDAPASKVEATRGYGAEIVTYDRYAEDREARAAELSEARGLTPIPAYDNFDVMAGAGTTALELIETAGPVDVFLACTSGGGLTAGCATATTALCPGAKIFGVEPEAGDDWARSLAAGERVKIPVPRTIADGQQVEIPGKLTFEINRRLLAGILLVSDDEIRAAMRFLFERLKLVVEPSGASAFAALLKNADRFRGQRVGVTLSGGNVGVERFVALMSGGGA
ncbi:MAG: pyridoxal-phosphate dependent enzyme [Alphaproteobacteria bacterium]|nr:pyridoxal-phosphate dependent enzyme [Alphaproteobacteria bacterium]